MVSWTEGAFRTIVKSGGWAEEYSKVRTREVDQEFVGYGA